MAVSSASAYVAFVDKDTGKWMPNQIKYTNGGAIGYNMSLAAMVRTNSIWKYGEKCDLYVSEIIDIPTAWIAEGQYPNVGSIDTAAAGTSEYKQTAAGANSYSLKLDEWPSTDTYLQIDRPTDATYPMLYKNRIVRW